MSNNVTEKRLPPASLVISQDAILPGVYVAHMPLPLAYRITRSVSCIGSYFLHILTLLHVS